MKELKAKPVKQAHFEELKARVKDFVSQHHRAPKLVVILVGNDPASEIYTRKKGEAALSIGMEHETIHFEQDTPPEKVHHCVAQLNDDASVDGILVQRPLPKSYREEELLFWITPEKDVDAFHPANAGKLCLGLPCLQPCTPAGVMKLLSHYQIEISGKVACVIGRSNIVGKPMAALLLQSHATVFHCHSKTPRLQEITRQADLLVVAAGKPKLVDASYLKKDVVVVDVGIHRQEDGKICGDVNYESAAEIASAITPVPGGVGPMTIGMLLENTIRAAEWRENSLAIPSLELG